MSLEYDMQHVVFSETTCRIRSLTVHLARLLGPRTLLPCIASKQVTLSQNLYRGIICFYFDERVFNFAVPNSLEGRQHCKTFTCIQNLNSGRFHFD